MNFISYVSKFNIFAMCEIWANSESDFTNFMPDYQHFVYARKKSPRAVRNSGGVTVLVKNDLIQNGTIEIIFSHLSDCVVLLMDNSNCSRLEDIILIFVYVSPENSKIYSAQNPNGIKLLDDQICEIITSYPMSEIFIAEDMNTRIKDFCDYITDDDLDFVFGLDTSYMYPIDSFDLPRKSKDNIYNNFGLSLVELCCTYGIHVLNGGLFNDIQVEYTCFVNNGASAVDYMMASTNLFPYFSDFGVSDSLFSIHCPVYCTLKLERHCVQIDSVTGEKLKPWEKIKWNESMKGDFLERFRNIFNNFRITFENSSTSAVDKLSVFIRMFQDAAVNMKRNKQTRIFC